MSNRVIKEIMERGVVAVIRMNDPTLLLQTVEAICKGGVNIIEITMTTPDACKMIEILRKEGNSHTITGVGSVLNVNMASSAIEAGAQFVVSPILKEEVLEFVKSANLPMIPGAFTPTEAQMAYELGAEIIKIFPADVVGMSFFKGIKAPMPHLNLMPTGGVTLTNVGDWVRAGACAVGVGNALLDKSAISEKNFRKLTENAKILIQGFREAKNQNKK